MVAHEETLKHLVDTMVKVRVVKTVLTCRAARSSRSRLGPTRNPPHFFAARHPPIPAPAPTSPAPAPALILFLVAWACTSPYYSTQLPSTDTSP